MEAECTCLGCMTSKFLLLFLGEYFSSPIFTPRFTKLFSIVCSLVLEYLVYFFLRWGLPCTWIYRPNFHENKPKMLVFSHWKRGLVFAKTGSINSGTGSRMPSRTVGHNCTSVKGWCNEFSGNAFRSIFAVLSRVFAPWLWFSQWFMAYTDGDRLRQMHPEEK